MKRILTRPDVVGRKIEHLRQTKGHSHNTHYHHKDFLVRLDSGLIFPMVAGAFDTQIELPEIDAASLVPLPPSEEKHTRPCLGHSIVDLCWGYWSPHVSVLLDNRQFLWIDIVTTLHGNETGFEYYFNLSDAADLDLEKTMTHWDGKPVLDLLKD